MQPLASLLQSLQQERRVPWWLFWLLGAIGLAALIAVIQMRRKPESVAKESVGVGASTKPLTSRMTTDVEPKGTGLDATEISRPAGLRQDPTARGGTGEERPPRAAAAEAELRTSPPDDLTKIEGVGPKISKLLQDADISTFGQLAATSVEQLRQILQDAKLSIANPETWPEQASLAAAGNWDELSQFQSTLKGGRRIT